MTIDAMKEFFEPPQITEHLGLAAWIFCSLGLLLGILLLAGALLVGLRSSTVATGIGSVAGGGLLALCLFIMLRAMPPGLGWSWWLLVGSVLVLISGTCYALWRLAQDPAPILGTCLGSALAMGLAIALDGLNEYMGGIPLAWGTVFMVIFIGLLWSFVKR